jgi:hypothetical protein
VVPTSRFSRARPLAERCGAGSAQRLLVDLELLGDIGLGDAESRGVLNESALVSSGNYPNGMNGRNQDLGNPWGNNFTSLAAFTNSPICCGKS